MFVFKRNKKNNISEYNMFCNIFYNTIGTYNAVGTFYILSYIYVPIGGIKL